MKNTIGPEELTAFLCVSEHMSFRRASRELGVEPSTLSHSIRKLEDKLGVRLLNRTTRSVSFTDAGKRLYTQIKPAFGQIEQALDELNGFRNQLSGTLRINSGPTGANLVVAPLVTQFLKEHPSAHIELITQSIMVDIVAGGFDAGVRFGQFVDKDMIAIPIGPPQRYAVVASSNFLKQWSAPKKPEDLCHLPCIRWRFDDGRIPPWVFQRGLETISLSVEGPLTTGSQELMVQAALDDIGLAYTFEGVSQHYVKTGQLVRVLEPWCQSYPGYHLYYHSKKNMPAILRAFIDFIRQNSESMAP